MKKRMKDASLLGVYILLGTLFFAMINYLGIRHYQRWDLTKSKVYSLTDQTQTILDELTADVQIYIFFEPINPLYDNVDELMKRYRAATEKVKVEFLDAEKNLLRARELVDRYGISEPNVIIIASGDKKKFIYQSDLAEMDYSGMQMGQRPTVQAFKGEEAITSAILNVTEADQLTVGFLIGHGEKGVDDYSGMGLSNLKTFLEKENYQVKTIAILGQEKVDEEVDMVVIPGPRAAFMEQEIGVLRDYLESGGHLLTLVDPVFTQSGVGIVRLGIEPLLLEYGIRIREDVILDPSKALPFVGAETIFIDQYRSHEITDKMTDIPCIFPLMRGVDSASPSKEVDVTILMTTSNEGWGESDLELLITKGQAEPGANDSKGPVSVAVAAEPEKSENLPIDDDSETISPEEGLKIVVIGDSEFVSNDHLENLGNRTLAVNTIHWLGEKATRISIPPKKPEQTHLRLNRQQMSTILLLTVLLLPALGIILGIFMWRMRRR